MVATKDPADVVERRLALRARDGDRSALADLYRRLAPAVTAYAAQRTADHGTGEDIAAETWRRVQANLHRYDPTYSFRPWLLGIARLVSCEFRMPFAGIPAAVELALREGQPYIANIPDGALDVAERVCRREEIERFLGWVRWLPPVDRYLLLRRGLDGWSHARIAAATGLSKAAVQQRWRRLTQRMHALRNGLFRDPARD